MDAKQAKQIHYMFFYAYVGLVLMLVIPVSVVPSRHSIPIVGGVFALVSVAMVVGCVIWSLFYLVPRAAVGEVPQLVEPGKLSPKILIALATGEMPALLGLVGFLGAGISPWPFYAATLLCFFLAVLPKLQLYWRLYEEQAK